MGELLGTIYGRLLMLLGLVAIGGLAIYAFSGGKVASQASEISLLQGNARQQLGATQSGFANFATAQSADLITAGIIPSGMVRNGALVDKWGGAITLASANNGAQGVIQLAGFTNNVKDCAKLATTLADYDTLAIGATQYTPDARPDAIAAGKACAASDTVTITFS
ncbi:type 4 pilus major pilin [Burkholderia gladioli]|uniref:type 4 pilus major pilin n=1 Tax=Burkholderia gladioli TaxID=28095 RepID=UPI00163E17FB|nr:type 4 pilus major pilin [Burkholderia gladioli]